jgi:phosphoribosyl-dephospho-CoA transferase
MRKLTKAQISTLREMQSYSEKRKLYQFRQATAKSLVPLGLVEVVPGDIRKSPFHRITDRGIAFLRALHSKEQL